ncbi:hypothetical protein IFM89_016129 [Coptis chinensis]|uniref:Cytochrome b5 heme-binding domain-containing protein n=1 Tax=Coptis chinensis TaxID=261450 RepID=A0A835HDC8_9MAGN|nr:hypothetical protein IFM89_016129 [Coptis chinensis]
MPTLTKLYNLKEAGEHNTRDDCWVVIDGKVYDVTTYLDEHPGGDDVLLNSTGRDATEDFNDAGHSRDAIQLMQEFCIGELDPTPTTPETETLEEKKTNFTEVLMNMTSQYWVVTVAIVGVSVVAGVLYLRKK